MEQQTEPTKQGSLVKSILKIALFLGFGLVVLYFVYRNQEAGYQLGKECDPTKYPNENLFAYVMQAFSETKPFWLVMVCLSFMVSNISRALRWNLLIEPLGYKPKLYNTFFATMVGYFINLAFPRAGELAKPATLAQYEKISLDKLIGTIVADRVFDVVMLLSMLGLTFLLQFQHVYNFLFGEKVPEECINPVPIVEQSFQIPWLLIFMIIVGIGFLGLLIIIIKWKAVKETAIYKKIRVLLVNFYEGAKTVFALKGNKLIQFFIHTIVIWLMYYLMMYFCFFAYEPTAQLGLGAALLAFVFGSFGMVVPSPGGIGAYQLAVTAALLIYGVSGPQAFAFSNIIFFTVMLFCNVLFGVLAYALLPILNRTKSDKGLSPK